MVLQWYYQFLAPHAFKVFLVLICLFLVVKLFPYLLGKLVDFLRHF